MKIDCGPESDRRTLDLTLPAGAEQIGVFVSGGIDSAILYYLMCHLNREQNWSHKIFPLTVTRKEGSRYFAKMVVDYIHDQMGLPKMPPVIAGDPTLDEDQQVRSGIIQAVVEYNLKPVYVGVIDALPEHMIGWQPICPPEDQYYKTPFRHLRKSHIVDLIYQYDQEFLLNITHSCAVKELGRCGTCNGCRERQWAFDQLGKTDPGNI